MRRSRRLFLSICLVFCAPTAWAASGTGPGGYSWVDCNEAGGPSCNYTSVSATDGSTGLCSEAVWGVPIGFNFPFYGQNYTTVQYSVNGVLYFTNAPSCSDATPTCSNNLNQQLTGTEGSRFISVWWLDWAGDNDDFLGWACGQPGCSNSGPFSFVESFRQGSGTDTGVRFKEVEWYSEALHRPFCSEPNVATFKARLYEDGRILLSYQDTDIGNASYNDANTGTIGVTKGADGEFTEVTYNNGLPGGASGPYAIEFTPPPACSDADGDGFCSIPEGGADCDDADNTVYPNAPELCDGLDNDCDGSIDEGAGSTWYADNDFDTYGDPGNNVTGCAAPPGYVADNTDCDDTNNGINPAAPEVCDTVDNDCDGLIDEGVGSNYYPDADLDTYGDSGAAPTLACSAPPGMVLDSSDCDDADAAVNPAAAEVCNGVDDDCDGTADDGLPFTDYYPDADADTWGDSSAAPTSTCDGPPAGMVTDNSDCDDADGNNYPGNAEVCDGADNDCDSVADNGLTFVNYYPDADADGAGDSSAAPTSTCDGPPAGMVADNSDCDDADGNNYPGNAEVCDGADNDCDSVADNGLAFVDYWPDSDNDGFGSNLVGPTNTCSGAPAGMVDNNLDCADNDVDRYPGNPEICDGVDNDCNGLVDDGLVFVNYYPDNDLDGFGSSLAAPTSTCDGPPAGMVADNTDCADNDVERYPGNPEICDGKDNDCNGPADDGLAFVDYYPDADADGFGRSSAAPTSTCSGPPAGMVTDNSDCADTDADRYPGNPETCDGKDNDCNGLIDDGVVFTDYYPDNDADGFGSASAAPTNTCAGPPPGMVVDNTDCNDNQAAAFPGNPEVCDSIDNDCDGTVDEGVTSPFYRDLDNDGVGDASDTRQACSAPPGYVAAQGDCDDSDPANYPGNTEVCDGQDNNCDGVSDEGLRSTYYQDLDGDGRGNPAVFQDACSQPAGYVAVQGDCDDNDPNNYIGNTEVCDGQDNDCDSNVDEGLTTTYYPDVDGDGRGDTSNPTVACSPPPGHILIPGDCDDNDPNNYIGNTEVCDGQDNDCDSNVDEGLTTTYYQDLDGDGRGNTSVSLNACSQPPGYTALAGDCDDTDASNFPGNPEVCDGADNDCDGTADDGLAFVNYWPDVDSDGYGDAAAAPTARCSGAPAGFVDNGGDCDDADASNFPTNPEVCDGTDNDCDGLVDDGIAFTDYWPDNDGDGFGDSAAAPTSTCSGAPAGTVDNNGDCDDSAASVNPGRAEISCDGIDNDCDPATADTRDADGDGVNVCVDCDDTDANNFPGNSEICDGADNDCNSLADDGLIFTDYWPDQDADGFGRMGGGATATCDGPPPGMVNDNSDCADNDAAVNPGAAEALCDGVDNDCDPTTSDDPDNDGDGVGLCTDCDDANPDNFPGNTELCDGADNDCDGAADNNLTFVDYYPDVDRDAFGDASAAPVATCDGPPAGMVADSGDCNDGDAAINPARPELGCDGLDNDCDPATPDTFDSDGDGSDVCTDCDDSDPINFPGNPESCDGSDNDCDGLVDDGLVFIDYRPDDDLDGFGDASAAPVSTCDGPPPGMVSDGSDCDDANAAVNPAAAELLCDGLDNDCDPATPDARDRDGDGFDECVDCDDAEAASFPGAFEQPYDGIDQDCDGADLTDVDGDGFDAARVGGTDCADGAAGVNPGAAEGPLCDGVDNDCNGLADDGTSCFDDDGDGFSEDGGDCDDTDANSSPAAVELPGNGIDDNCDGRIDEDDRDGDGFDSAADCNDGDAAVFPGATELPNGVDDNCDGLVDEGTDRSDDDGDGYSESGGDCDDADPGRNPGAAELPDGLDQDCDSEIDEETEAYDDDGDGFCEGVDLDGDGALDCSDGSAPGDCVDSDDAVFPGATEQMDGVDNDCDGVVDGGLGVDADGDGYTDTAGGDCDDTDSTVNPGATEQPDGVDEDCDGTIDETTAAYDDDGDGWCEGWDLDGDGSTECSDGSAPGDCDDGDPGRAPDAIETVDGADQDCDGVIDNDTPAYDDDGDGFSEDGGDCDDGDALVSPAEAEVLDNGVDDNCNGEVDEIFEIDTEIDVDGDGLTIAEGDCDDRSAAVFPGAEELCDGIDNDCDGAGDPQSCDENTADGCAQSAGPGGGFGWLILGILGTAFLRRRRRASSPRGSTTSRMPAGRSSAQLLGPALLLASASMVAAGCSDVSVNRAVGRIGTTPESGIQDFGVINVSESVSKELHVFNAGGGDVAVASISLEQEGPEVFSVEGADFSGTLKVGEDVTITVTYNPNVEGTHRARVVVRHQVATTGTGSSEAEGVTAIGLLGHAAFLDVTANPLVVDFGQVATGMTAQRDLVVANRGFAPVSIADVTLDSAAFTWRFAQQGLTLPAVVEAQESLVLRVDFLAPDDLPVQVGVSISVSTITVDALLVANECNGSVDPSWDGDGDGLSPCAGDCDDGDADIGPHAQEVQDGVDNDCDLSIDEDTPGYDDDGDCACEEGPCLGSVEPACGLLVGGDCVDHDPTVGPDAPEDGGAGTGWGDGVDNDCDGTVDEGTNAWDGDGDGYSGFGGDCDDADPLVFPGNTEQADGVDQNCEGRLDEGTEAWDDDGDGFCEGVDLDGDGVTDCSDGATPGDCDDRSAARAPGLAELADGIDNDCDDAVEGGGDADGDGYAATHPGTGAVLDCDDSDPGIFPGAVEIRDGADQDCNGLVDDRTSAWDDDGDCWCETAPCEGSVGACGLIRGGDCDDAAAGRAPDRSESVDGADNDCDGTVDEDTDAYDDDGDGYTEDAGDCDDADSARYPGQVEDDGNSVDDDCDGLIDEPPY